MTYLLNVVSAVSPAPGQEDGLRPGLDPSQVTPGLLGFIFTLLLVVAVIFLIRDMSRRIRRVRYQAMQDEAVASEGQEDLLDDDSPASEDRSHPDTRPGSTPGQG